MQPIANTETSAKHPLGTRRRSRSILIYGGGEFIYLKGVASTVVGSLVTYDGASSGTPTYQTVLCPSTANLAQPVAVAMSANVANQFGWYQIMRLGGYRDQRHVGCGSRSGVTSVQREP
jgi:hypothetical protein